MQPMEGCMIMLVQMTYQKAGGSAGVGDDQRALHQDEDAGMFGVSPPWGWGLKEGVRRDGCVDE
jgi:hypothetical protein